MQWLSKSVEMEHSSPEPPPLPPILSSNSFSGCSRQCSRIVCTCVIRTHTFAVVKAKEDFKVLNTALTEAIKEVNELIESSQIEIGGDTVHLDFYLGGDYKVYLMTRHASYYRICYVL